jgi:REP element-mobilizing transposase RayT
MKTEFANDEYYHIYNRGIDKRDIFVDDLDYKRFLLSMNLLNDVENGLMHIWKDAKRMEKDLKTNLVVTDKNQSRVDPRLDLRERLNNRNKLIEIVCYCLNPNHYHFILKQKEEKGVQKFMQKLGIGYTMYFNKKQKRSGSLFQGKFKSIHIDSNEYLLYLSAYVNQNHFIHGYKDKNWQYSSYLDFVGERNGVLCNKADILDQFGSVDEYKEFVENNSLYLKEKKELEKYILE